MWGFLRQTSKAFLCEEKNLSDKCQILKLLWFKEQWQCIYALAYVKFVTMFGQGLHAEFKSLGSLWHTVCLRSAHLLQVSQSLQGGTHFGFCIIKPLGILQKFSFDGKFVCRNVTPVFW